MDTRKLAQQVKETLVKFGYTFDADGFSHEEIYADYRDTVEEKEAVEYVSYDDPWLAFEQTLSEGYNYAAYEMSSDLTDRVVKELDDDEDMFPDGLSRDEKEFIRTYVKEHVAFDPPAEHYLKQKLDVNIELDTGDGALDYCANAVYPCWYGSDDEPIADCASLVWLAQSQGYTKEQLWTTLVNGVDGNTPKFLKSAYQEVVNICNGANVVTFLVKMTLRQLLDLWTVIKRRNNDLWGEHAKYDARCLPDTYGHIVLDKSTMCGLFSPWDGGGSVLDIELDKDIKIPLRFIRAAMPDANGGGEYCVGNVYGMSTNAWKDNIKEISLPEVESE